MTIFFIKIQREREQKKNSYKRITRSHANLRWNTIGGGELRTLEVRGDSGGRLYYEVWIKDKN